MGAQGATLLKRYGAALAAAAAACGAAELLRPYLRGQIPLTPYTIAVFLAAVYGGFGPGLLTTALSMACLFWLMPGEVLSPVLKAPGPFLFGATGFVICFIVARFRREHDKVAAANRELSKRSEALARSNEELERFAYALSHDLQTPLRTVSMFTERLEAKLGAGADKETATSLRFILEGVGSMQAMISGLLEYATASQAAPLGARADLNAVVRTVLQDLRSQVEESGAVVTTDPMPMVAGDETRLRQVFQNLVANAIKYRSERPPKIHVGAKQGVKEWIFCVGDNGTGIDMQYKEKIFELFERVEKSKGGTGIGLAVSRAVVERHGGRIWVESQLGEGATFYFTLPM